MYLRTGLNPRGFRASIGIKGHGVNMEAFDRLMKKRGYSMVGANYRLEN